MVANPTREKIDSLTIVRFFAAFAVFIMHSGIVFLKDPSSPKWLVNLVDHGGEGVTIFLVLSGFILTYNYRDRIVNSQFRFQDYFLSRFARIYPMYLLALILSIPFMISFARYMGTSYSLGYMAIDGMARVFLVHAWYPYFNTHPHWLTQGWTLSVEFLFYTSFPFLLRLIESKKSSALIIWVIAIIISWLPRYLIMGQTGPGGVDFVQQFPLLRLPEFIVGICSFYLYEQWKTNARYFPILKYGSIALLLGTMCIPFRYGESPLFMLITLGSSLLIIGLAGQKKAKDGPIRRMFIFLGEASYSMYLMHGFVVLFIVKATKHYFQFDPERSYLVLLVSFILTLFVSAFFYLCVEEPARQWVQKKAKERKARKLVLNPL